MISCHFCYEIVTCILLADSLYCFLGLHILRKPAAMLQKSTQQKTDGSFQPVASKKVKPSVQYPERNWILQLALYVSLEADPCPVWPFNENAAPELTTWLLSLQDSEAEDPTKLYLDLYGIETETINVYCLKLLNFGIIHYTAVGKQCKGITSIYKNQIVLPYLHRQMLCC